MAKNKRNKDVHTRYTEEEYARVQVQAKAAGKSVGTFVRDCSLNEQAVHIIDGKEIAIKIGNLHNQMINYHNDIYGRIHALENAVNAYSTLLKTFPNSYSPEARETVKLFNMSVESAVNLIQRAYPEYENRAEEALHSMLKENMQRGDL